MACEQVTYERVGNAEAKTIEAAAYERPKTSSSSRRGGHSTGFAGSPGRTSFGLHGKHGFR